MNLRFRPRLDPLEPRDAPAVLTWKTAGLGDFNDPANWGGVVPGPADTAVINQSRAIVSAASGRVAAGSVVLQSGRLVGGLMLPGAFEWVGGAISGGAAGITVVGPTFIESQVPKALDGGTLTLLGGGRFTDGILDLDEGSALFNAQSRFDLDGGTITGDGRIVNAGTTVVTSPTEVRGFVNGGTLIVPVGTGTRFLRVEGDYIQTPAGQLVAARFGPPGLPVASILVTGTARLAGRFSVTYSGPVDSFELLPTLRAARVTGGFVNVGRAVNDGTKTILSRSTGLSVAAAAISNELIAQAFGQLSPEDLQNLTLLFNEVTSTLEVNDDGRPAQPPPQQAVEDGDNLVGGQRDRQERSPLVTLLRVLVRDGTVNLFTRFGVAGGTEDAGARARSAAGASAATGGRATAEEVVLPPPPPVDLPVEDPAKALAEEAAYLLTGLRPRSDLLPQRGRNAAPVATLLGGSASGDGRRPNGVPASPSATDTMLPGLLIELYRRPVGPPPPPLPGMTVGILGLAGVLLNRNRDRKDRSAS